MATLNIKGFPDGLHRKLKARAKKNRRSVAQEVTQILSELIDAPKPLSIMDLQGLVRGSRPADPVRDDQQRG
jgi:plasmid stability protein